MPKLLTAPALHRSLGLLAGALLLYLGGSGVAVQFVDLAAIVRKVPATDPDMQAMAESLDGPANYAVIAAADYAAPPLPARFDLAAAFTRIAARTGGAPDWIELRMGPAGPMGRARVSGRIERFSPIDGHRLADEPVTAGPGGPPPSRHLVAKHWHRLWALGDGMLWIEVLAGLALAGLVGAGMTMWWRVWRIRSRMGQPSPWWSAGGRMRSLHRTLAVLATAPLLVVAVSGAVLSLDSLSLAVYRWRHPDRLMFGMVPVGMVADYSSPLSPREIATMAHVLPRVASGMPIRAVRLRVFAGMRQAVVITGDSEPRQRVFDTRSGRAVSMSQPGYPDTVFPTGWEWHERLKRIHRGDAFGPVGRWLDVFAGLSLVWLAGSGLWLWTQTWRRRRRSGRTALFWR